MTKREMVLIDWVDSCVLAGSGLWHDADAVGKLVPSICLSVGVVIAETAEHVTLVGHLSDGCHGGEMCIPVVAITGRHSLGYAETPETP